ncbi:hypothetical protein chiPu_0011285 [Chiloscyllium punctatum]|uniref:Uncharacterized protein n=1 Tax=Chiloscyllium punctatum TaxID=137246 RepID=A0A401SQZ7_CHIPU|nr:hypothetical protein [Chiloscyllium punctatum]
MSVGVSFLHCRPPLTRRCTARPAVERLNPTEILQLTAPARTHVGSQINRTRLPQLARLLRDSIGPISSSRLSTGSGCRPSNGRSSRSSMFG